MVQILAVYVTRYSYRRTNSLLPSKKQVIIMTIYIIAILLLACFEIVAPHTPAEPSFYSAATATRRHDQRVLLYDQPRPRPKKRGEVLPQSNEPIEIESLRKVNYGEEGHPYEQVYRVRKERRRLGKVSGDDGHQDHQDHEIHRILQNSGYQPLRIHFDTVSNV